MVDTFFFGKCFAKNCTFLLQQKKFLAARLAQERRLADATRISDEFFASLFPRRQAHQAGPPTALRPFEGTLPRGAELRQLDPLGLERTRYDVPPDLTLQEWLAPETAALKAAFERHGIARGDRDYRETLRIANIPDKPDLIVRVQNIVHTNYCDTDETMRNVESDEESCQGQGNQRRSRASAATDDSHAPRSDHTGGYRVRERVDDDDDDGDERYYQGVGGVGRYSDSEDEFSNSDEEAILVESGMIGDYYQHAQVMDDAFAYSSPDVTQVAPESALAGADAGASIQSVLKQRPSKTAFWDPRKHDGLAQPARPRVFFSLPQAQRKLLGIGYHKNRVGTAIGVHYAWPWSGSQLAFPKGRVLGTGTNNRKVDRIALIHGLCAYLRKAGAHNLRLKSRTSQNFVAKCQLPTKTGLCLGRICQQLKDRAEPTKKFTGIVVQWEPATLLMFEYGSMICIGTSSIAQLEHAVETIAPVVMDNFRTPENEAQEQEMFRTGALKGFTPNQLVPRLATWDEKAAQRRRQNNEARRRPKVRYMGSF